MKSIRDYINLLEAHMPHDPLGIVARIREMDTAMQTRYHENADKNVDPEKLRQFQNSDRNKSYFHCSPCGRCGSPVWQQPCPVCDYYPYGSMDGDVRHGSPEWEERKARYHESAHAKFNKLVNNAGNYAAWFFLDKKKTVAFKEPYNFEHWVQPFVDQALSEQWPSADEIWEAYGDKE